MSKKIPLVITKPEGEDFADEPNAVHIKCDEANFDQVRDITDIVQLFEVLPELIEENRAAKKRDSLNIRISTDDKNKISQMARSRGYKNLSKYIIDKALAEN